MSEYSQNLAKYCDDQRFLIPAAKGAIKLDDHQQEAMEMAAISLFCNERAFSIVHSCGSGKTYLEGNLLIASKRAKDSLEKTGDSQDIIVTTERALIYSVRDQLLDLGLDVGVWGLGGKSLDRPVILASIQALQKNADRLVKEIPPEKVAMLIGDEADLFLTEKRKEIIRKFPEAIKIGLTATPSWPDGRNIEELWGRKMHELKLKEGILKGVNVPPMFTLFEVNIDDQNIAVTDGDYDKKILDAALREAEIEKAVSEVYSSLIPERRRKDFPT